MLYNKRDFSFVLVSEPHLNKKKTKTEILMILPE